MPYSDPIKQKEAQHQSYLRHKKEVLRRSKNKSDVKRALISKIKEVPCSDCGIQYPFYVMQFDHRDGVDKIEQISKLVAVASWNKILEEIEKCDIVCSNCHAIRTWKRRMVEGAKKRGAAL